MADHPLVRWHRVALGRRLFAFETFEMWKDKATSWYAPYLEADTLAVDAHGRVCRRGKHFMRARDEDAFPVAVYAIDEQGAVQ